MTGALVISNVVAANQALQVSGRADFLSNITVQEDLAIDTDTLFVDASKDSVGINVGTTLETNIGLDVRGGSIAGIRVQGNSSAPDATSHMLYLDSGRDSYFDDANHAMMFLTYGNGGITPGEGSNWVFNGRAADRDFIFRNNSSNKLIIQGNGGLVIQNSGTNDGLTVDNMIVTQTGLTLGTTANNDEAPIYFLGNTGGSDGSGGYLSNFRVGNGIIGNDIFEITPNDGSQGATTWKSTPALAIQGTNNRVAINTTTFSGQDNTDPNNIITRFYALNIEGNFNINNGNLFVDNKPFVTSRWTEAPNNTDIYRPTKVGINFSSAKNPTESLDVEGSIDVSGTLKANGQEQWIDSYGVVKVSSATINEDLIISSGLNAFSFGPIGVGANNIVTIQTGATWVIL